MKNPRKKNFILGIDIGGTKMSVLLGTLQGKILARSTESSHARQGPNNMIQRLVLMSWKLLQDKGIRPSNLLGIGISCGGPLDSTQGIVYSPPNLPGWDHIPVKKIFEKEFHTKVFLENDANATALAEYFWGGGRGKSNVVYLTMGTGIGGGIILDGKLYRGTNDLAGEIGHAIVLPDGPKCKCGKHGCLEALASGTGITTRARKDMKKNRNSILWKLTGGNPNKLTTEMVCLAARKGDALAKKVIKDAAYYMGVGLSNLIQTLNPEVIVIGTLMFKARDLLLEPVRENVRKLTWPRMQKVCKIIPSPLREKNQDLATLAITKYVLQK